ncbi:MAG: hypothetical protein LBS30_06685 [Planctomycetota bacterium]|nr:hypothetical protein [Planctomycetota bacterium]
MSYAHMPGRAKAAKMILLSVCIAIAGMFSAAALDYNDVKNLIANQVPESVITSLVQQNPSFVITTDHVNELRGMGASETLIGSLLTASTPQTAATYVEPGTVYYDPVVVGASPTVVYQTPTYVYPSHPTYYHPGRPRFGFSIGFGSGWGRRHGHGYGGRHHPWWPHR